MKKATMPQNCARCGEAIWVGDPIARSSRGFIHAGCASGADDE